MHRLSSLIIIGLVGLTANLYAQNPHGSDSKLDCNTCHTSDSWKIPDNFWKPQTQEGNINLKDDNKSTGYFNHQRTGFELVGQHIKIDCRDCHQSLVFSDAHSECVACHTDMHNQTVGTDCARCHTSENWLIQDVTLLHYQNGFPMLGAHAIADCYDCHQSASLLTFERIGNDCWNCHSDEYASTTNPDHKAAGFSTDCTFCHNMNAFDWFAESIIHDFFPLTGGHQINDCGSCHAGGDFSNTSPECYSCHQNDYASATNPDHRQLNLPTDCQSCHTTDPGWSPADFSIHNNYYPLVGAHGEIANDCAACHEGNYDNTPNTCVGCHLDDYNSTNDPNHMAAGFPTDCNSCHTENGWEPASFDHDGLYFPIYSGSHREAWDRCTDCHTVPANYASFSCIDCHEHSNRNEVDNQHNEVSGYVYASPECFACHPTGRSE